MSTTMRLSLVVPCYNEVEVVTRFHEALSRELVATGRPYEIVYVDDGSTDGTLDELVKLAAADDAVRYLSFSRNFGKEAAMLAGLRYAGGDAVVIMDADLQHPPELIGRMLEQYERGFDQVIARRTRTGDPATRTLVARRVLLADQPLGRRRAGRRGRRLPAAVAAGGRRAAGAGRVQPVLQGAVRLDRVRVDPVRVRQRAAAGPEEPVDVPARCSSTGWTGCCRSTTGRCGWRSTSACCSPRSPPGTPSG